MSKHTPEPWFQVGLNVITEICSFNVYENIAFFEKEEDAERVLKCVNACGGMENPAEEIQAMREEIERLTKENRSMMIEQQSQFDLDGAEITKLRADKARLIEMVDGLKEYTWSNSKLRKDAEQLLIEMEDK